MKHSPAPWQKHRSVACIDDLNGHTVAGVSQILRSAEEFEANARLIAAAPEMLEELEFLIEHCAETAERTYSGGLNYEVEVIRADSATTKRIKELIARVRGGA